MCSTFPNTMFSQPIEITFSRRSLFILLAPCCGRQTKTNVPVKLLWLQSGLHVFRMAAAAVVNLTRDNSFWRPQNTTHYRFCTFFFEIDARNWRPQKLKSGRRYLPFRRQPICVPFVQLEQPVHYMCYITTFYSIFVYLEAENSALHYPTN